MLPYKIRKPVYGGSKKSNTNAESATSTPLYGDEDDPRVYGGGLQRAILSDLMDLKSRYLKLFEESNSQTARRGSSSKSPGQQFTLFKRAFQQARFGCIHNRVVPPRVDRGEYSQLLYSCCFYLLNDALEKQQFQLNTFTDATTNSDKISLDTESTALLKDVSFAIFALNTLHQTNTLPTHVYDAKETFHHPGMQMNSKQSEIELQRQWSHLPLGSASEGRVFRRYYKYPVRIDRGSYLALMYVRHVCAAIAAKYKCTSNDNDPTATSCCNLAKDLIQIMDRMLSDDAFFSYCEYHGPVGLEGLAGNPVFYMAHYGLEGGMSVRAKKKAKRQVKTGPVKKCGATNILSQEQLQSTICQDENLTDVTGLSLLLEKHRSNLQSIQTELRASRHKHQYKQHEFSDLKPRQRELVEKTLSEVLSNGVGCNTKTSYVDMVRVLSGSEKPSSISCHKKSPDKSLVAEMQVKTKVPNHYASDQGLAVPPSDNAIPVTLPSSISSWFVNAMREALSDFDSIVESVRLNVLKERNEAIAKTTEQRVNVEFDATLVDFSALDAAHTAIQPNVHNQSSSMCDEISVTTGAGRKALNALLSASTIGKQQQKKSHVLDEFWNLQAEQLLEAEHATGDDNSLLSDEIDEFSVSTGAGKNAILKLLALSEYSDAVQPEERKKQTKRRLPSMKYSSNDNVSSEDSSVSDSSTEVGKLALQSLLSMATANDKPSPSRTTRSTGGSNAKTPTTTSKPSPVKRKRAGTPKQKAEPRSGDEDDASQATGGGKRALAELLASI